MASAPTRVLPPRANRGKRASSPQPTNDKAISLAPATTKAKCNKATTKKKATKKATTKDAPKGRKPQASNMTPPSISFLEKERKLAAAQVENDYLMTLPEAKYSYLTDKGKLNFYADRFYIEPKKVKQIKILSAGKPFDTPYRPRFDATVESEMRDGKEDAFHSRPTVKLIVPDTLKALLVDDWENVTKNNQLVPLPHAKPVTKVLADYYAYEAPKRQAGSSHVDILEETLAGLKEYFEKSLGRILLYRFERIQHAEVSKKWVSNDPEFQGKGSSDTYGVEHLMRLVVSLPELIAQTNMDQQSVNRLREELAKFCTWLSKNSAEYFVSAYESPAQEYNDKAKN